MHDFDLILTLTGGLAAALICGYVTFRLGLSPLVGYLLAGIAVGPNTPGFIANQHIADEFAEVGVILLMFGVGLQFHLKELLAVRRVAVPGALGQCLLTTLIGMLVGLAYGWNGSYSLIFGFAISVASTVVLLRILADNNDLHTPTGHIAVGWLVVEDLFTVVVLVLIPALFAPGAGGWGGSVLAIGGAVLKLAAMVGLMFLGGTRAIPWLLERVAATRSRELFTLSVLALALGIAVGSARVFGVSMSLGAFLAGMVVGRSEFSLRAASEALPMRDAFAVLFFVSVGMLFDPHHLLASPGLVLATLAVILLGKPLIALAIVVFLKYPLRIAVSVAVALAQIGEFSFILIATGKSLGILDQGITNMLVPAAILSITLNPILYRLVGPLEFVTGRLLKRLGLLPAPPSTSLADEERAEEPLERYRAIIVGYGPVGRTLARLFRENRIEPVVVELNMETVRQLGLQGIRGVYGDVSHRETLIEAGITDAVSLVLSGPTMEGSRQAIQLARELNPNIFIVARSIYLGELPHLHAEGADLVFSGEGEVALAMTVALLRELGATPEQLDRARDRIRAELLGTAEAQEPHPGRLSTMSAPSVGGLLSANGSEGETEGAEQQATDPSRES